jgi:hypothetical protein
MSKTKFTIDCSVWRCGAYSEDDAIRLGSGPTELLSEDGYMCCLGQVALQLGVPKEDLLHRQVPQDMSEENRKKAVILLYSDGIGDDPLKAPSRLSRKAVNINDDMFMSVSDKMENLTNLFKEEGFELEFNTPHSTRR